MKNKKIVVITIFSLVFLLLLIFFLSKNNEDNIFSLKEEYLFNDIEEYTVENKTLKSKDWGISFFLPDGWKVDTPKNRNGILITSSNYKENKNSPLPLEGCGVFFSLYENKKELDYLQATISSLLREKIERKDGSVVRTGEENGYGIGYKENSLLKILKVPKEKKIFLIEAYFSRKDFESCEKAHKEILKSVSFEK